MRKLLLGATIPFVVPVMASTSWSFAARYGAVFTLLAILTVMWWWLIVLLLFATSLLERQWSAAGRTALLLALSVPLVLLGVLSGDYIHLAIMYPGYRQVIASAPQGPVRFPWGDQAVSALDGLQFRTLVYDADGTVRANIGLQRPAAEGLAVSTSHFVGNFFIELTHS